jgi:hypothetical protein
MLTWGNRPNRPGCVLRPEGVVVAAKIGVAMEVEAQVSNNRFTGVEY